MKQDHKQAESYLWDMREAGRLIAGFMRGVKLHEFEKNKVVRLAVERLLMIIGEAASHVSPQYRNQHPEVAWKILVGFRNVLAHEYDETLLNRVWLASTVAIPEMLATLIKLLPEDE